MVDSDFAQADAAARKLLTAVTDTETQEAAIRAQLVELHLRLFAEVVEPDSEAVSETYGVFQATLVRTGDVRHAWMTTISAMLQDLRIVYY